MTGREGARFGLIAEPPRTSDFHQSPGIPKAGPS